MEGKKRCRCLQSKSGGSQRLFISCASISIVKVMRIC